jgi:kumamolisin
MLAPDSGRAQLMAPTGTAGPARTIVLPASSVVRPEDAGLRAHTNIQISVPPAGVVDRPPSRGAVIEIPPFSGTFIETPASLACIYRLVPGTPGCNPNTVTTNPAGGSRAIAIVDAFHYLAAASDLAAFDTQFGLAPPPSFSVIYGSSASCVTGGTVPPDGSGTGWDLEAALDIQWAHAMAPSATLYLVEANSDSLADMFAAVRVAALCVQGAGGGFVSMSWGGREFAGELAFDSTMTASGVVYVAAAGDVPGVSYPAASPNVVSVGGTSISRFALSSTGPFEGESAWISTGGGLSAYESRPTFQDGIAYVIGNTRATPDVAYTADPRSPVWVYNTTCRNPTNCPPSGPWFPIGGTSLATPLFAGVANAFGTFAASSQALNQALYSIGLSVSYQSTFNDINSGSCGGTYNPFLVNWFESVTGIGWDPCTGWGSLHGSH